MLPVATNWWGERGLVFGWVQAERSFKIAMATRERTQCVFFNSQIFVLVTLKFGGNKINRVTAVCTCAFSFLFFFPFCYVSITSRRSLKGNFSPFPLFLITSRLTSPLPVHSSQHHKMEYKPELTTQQM